MPISEEDAFRLVGRIYEASASSNDIHGLGSILCDAMDVDSGIVFIAERSSGRMLHLVSASANFDEAARADYAAHYHAINPWFGQALRRRPPYTARGEELIDSDRFARSEFAADWCTRVGIYHMIGSTRDVAPNIVVGAGIHRDRRGGAFGDEEARIYGIVTEHVGRALEVAWRLNTLECMALASLETVHALGMGLMLLDRECRPLFMNAIAERLLRHSRWFGLRSAVVTPVNPSDRPAFQEAVRQTADTSGGTGLGSGGTLRIGDPLEGPMAVFVAPFRSSALAFGDRRPAAVVQFSDPDATRLPEPGAIATAFGLSAAEAALVGALIEGRTLSDHAAEAGISVNTAKTYLARAFAKTGTQRQGDLIALVLSRPSLRADWG